MSKGFLLPLAERLRPKSLGEVFGQELQTAGGGILQDLVDRGEIPNLLLYGPPGSGKTSIARLLLGSFACENREISAVTATVKDLRAYGEVGERLWREQRQPLLLFIDEIHRFNRAQQDVLLPYMESGCLRVIGATTENPGFELIAPLLSRMITIVLRPHDHASLVLMYEKARQRQEISVELSAEALEVLANSADGDARWFINQLQQIDTRAPAKTLEVEELIRHIPKKIPAHDRDRDQHYDLISVLHKAVRASDVQGSLYWVGRLIHAGEAGAFLLRRLTRMAVEDIGLAEPQILNRCLVVWDAYERMGSPEGDLLIYQLVVELASAPKSNSIYVGAKKIQADIERTGSLPIPLTFKNAANRFMREHGYGEGYIYDHDCQYHISRQRTLPEQLDHALYYQPGELGHEREIRKRMDFILKIKGFK